MAEHLHQQGCNHHLAAIFPEGINLLYARKQMLQPCIMPDMAVQRQWQAGLLKIRITDTHIESIQFHGVIAVSTRFTSDARRNIEQAAFADGIAHIIDDVFTPAALDKGQVKKINQLAFDDPSEGTDSFNEIVGCGDVDMLPIESLPLYSP